MHSIFSKTLTATVLISSLLFLANPSLSAEEGQEPVKKEKPVKEKMLSCSGTISAIDAAKHSITVVLDNKEVEDADAKAESITLVCDEKTKIKSGKDSVELSALPNGGKVSVKYSTINKIASSIRVKQEKKAKTKDTDEDNAEKKSDD